MERDLRAVDEAVVGEADFDGEIEEGVVVGMDIERDGGGKKRGGVEEEVDLGEMLIRGSDRRIGERSGLGNGDVLDCLAVVRFLADIDCEIA